MNCPAGTKVIFVPIEVTASAGTLRPSAQARWCSFAFPASKGATARGGGLAEGGGSCLAGTGGGFLSFGSSDTLRTSSSPRRTVNDVHTDW